MTNTPAWLLPLLVAHAVYATHAGPPAADFKRVETFPFEEVCKAVDANPRFDFQARGREKIAQAIDETLKSKGHANLAAAVHKKLTDMGIGPVELDAAGKKALGENLLKDWFGGRNYGVDGVSEDIDLPPAALQPKWIVDCKKLTQGLPSTKDGEKYLDAVRAALPAYKERVENEEKLLTALNPTELFSNLAQMCRNARYYSKEAPTSSYCRETELRRLKNETVRFYADGAKPDRARAEATLKTKLIGAFREARATARSFPKTAPDPEKLDEAKATEMHVTLSNAMSDMCDTAGNGFRTVASRGLNELRDSLALAKPTIKSLESAFLSDKHYATAEKLTSEAGAEVADFFEKEIAPRAKLKADEVARVVKEMKAIAVKHHEPVPAEGATVLDEYLKTSPFLDATLAGFRDIGASYHYRSALGKKVLPESVHLEPLIVQLATDAPAAVQSVLLHEVGHKIGPSLKEISGIDLDPALGKLRACFKKQFNMRDIEFDESFSDWISATLQGRRIAAIADPKKREAALQEVISPFCNFQKNSNGQTFGERDEHPHSLVRLERLFGADPNLRAAQGLPAAPYCTLDGEKS